jgi:hypothetical protein
VLISSRHVLWAIALTLATFGGRFAWAQPDPPSDLAQTPVARQLDWVLRCINDRAVPEPQQRFSPRFLEQHELTEVVDRLRNLRDRVFDGTPVSVVRDEQEPRADAISCIIGNEEAERYLSLILAVDEASGRISVLLLVTASGGERNPTPSGWNDLAGDFGRRNDGVWFGAYEVAMDQPGTPRADVRIRDIYEFGNPKSLAITTASRVYLLLTIADAAVSGRLPSIEHLPALVAEVAKGSAPASDTLLAALTRPAVQACLSDLQERPAPNLPFLSRAEAALLKSPIQGDVLQRFMRVDEAERTAMLAPGGLVSLHRAAFPDRLQTRPVEVQRVGWFATRKEAAYAMARLALLERDAKVIGAGLPAAWRQPQPPPRPLPRPADAPPAKPVEPLALDPAVWKDHVLLAGSEPGVYTLLMHLTSHDDRTFALVMTWNHVDAPLEEPRLHELARRGVTILARDLEPSPSTRP